MAAQPARLAPSAQMWGVIQRSLASDLKTKRINVAIVGEKHYEIDPDEEVSQWEKEGIKVFYEGDKVTHSSGEITPDPLSLRLFFGWTALTERVSDYLDTVSKSGKVIDTSGFDDINWVLKYLLPVLKGDLERGKSIKPELGEALGLLEELRPILRGSRSKKLGGANELERKILASKLRRNMNSVGEILSNLHSESNFSTVPYRSADLSVERSRQMLSRVNNRAGSMEKTIYKVGNNHVLDMRRERWEVKPAVRIYNKEEYHLEYQGLKQKAITPSVPKVSSSSSIPPQKVIPPSVKVSSPSLTPPLPEGWSEAVTSGGMTYYYIPDDPSSSTWTRPTSPAPRLMPTISLPPTPLITSKSSGHQSPSLSNPIKLTAPITNKPPTISSRSSVSNMPSPLKSSPGSDQPKKRKKKKEKREKRETPVIQIVRVRPTWIPDDRRPNCSKCDAEFGILTRRHHCRACGEVFCSTCCSQKKVVPSDVQAVDSGKSPTTSPVLVCNDCFRNL